MDLGELRKAVLAILDDDRVDVPWDHILGGGHRVSGDEILRALEDGAYDHHETVDGRYVAAHREWRARLAIVVLFELLDVGGDRRIQVLTAYHLRTARGRARRR